MNGYIKTCSLQMPSPGVYIVILRHAKKSNAGKYTCVDNSGSEVSIQLVVLDPPQTVSPSLSLPLESGLSGLSTMVVASDTSSFLGNNNDSNKWRIIIPIVFISVTCVALLVFITVFWLILRRRGASKERCPESSPHADEPNVLAVPLKTDWPSDISDCSMTASDASSGDS
jgi:hypothetical protein